MPVPSFHPPVPRLVLLLVCLALALSERPAEAQISIDLGDIADVVIQTNQPVRRVRLTGPVVATDVAGVTGSVQLARGATANPRRALYGLSLAERRDHPCRFVVHTRRTDPTTVNDFTDYHSRRAQIGRCAGERPVATAKDYAGLLWHPLVDGRGREYAGYAVPYLTDQGSTQDWFVAGVSACISGGKVKGIRLRAGAVDRFGDGGVSPVSFAAGYDPGIVNWANVLEIDRTNCGKSEWTAFQTCPDGMIAVGARAHFNRNREPDDLSGLQLLCRQVAIVTLPAVAGGQLPTDEEGDDLNDGRD